MTLHLSGVSFAYRPQEAVLKEIDFSLNPGELVAMVGPNGAGKSTLLMLMAGLLAPELGSVTLDGKPLGALPSARRAQRIAFVPQAEGSPTDLPVEEVVALGRLARQGFRERLFLRPLSREDEEATHRALEEMDLLTMRERSFASLSGGEKARVRLAVALAQEASLLLLDEPGAHLDPGHARDMMARLLRQKESGRGVAMAMHDLALASLFADRLVLMEEGRITASGPPEEVLTTFRVEEAFGKGLLVIPHPRSGRPVVLPDRDL